MSPGTTGMEKELIVYSRTGPDEVLLKLNATGLCMSDIHYMMNDWNVPPMSASGVRCPGHEGAGVVVKLGSNVKGWKVGDRGGVKPIWDSCGACEQCWDGRDNYCPKMVLAGLSVNGTSIRSTRRTPFIWLNIFRHLPTVHYFTSEVHVAHP